MLVLLLIACVGATAVVLALAFSDDSWLMLLVVLTTVVIPGVFTAAVIAAARRAYKTQRFDVGSAIREGRIAPARVLSVTAYQAPRPALTPTLMPVTTISLLVAPAVGAPFITSCLRVIPDHEEPVFVVGRLVPVVTFDRGPSPVQITLTASSALSAEAQERLDQVGDFASLEVVSADTYARRRRRKWAWWAYPAALAAGIATMAAVAAVVPVVAPGFGQRESMLDPAKARHAVEEIVRAKGVAAFDELTVDDDYVGVHIVTSAGASTYDDCGYVLELHAVNCVPATRQESLGDAFTIDDIDFESFPERIATARELTAVAEGGDVITPVAVTIRSSEPAPGGIVLTVDLDDGYHTARVRFDGDGHPLT